ncbi:hypothetical protein EVAR_91701_1 [Eumeta japonica]|uniref:Reverse transcriptase domain-containing protein n=1 Tax=Eumeta variegata TaxID=151549 RepID=A0A4C2ACM1_EUMVA|nr:hypothetical protein EVAR_91701_1 [Eumeta japonica]
MDELSVKCLLNTDYQIILAPSACGQQAMVNKMNDFVTKRSMKVNVGKTKVMVFEKAENTTKCDIHIKVDKDPAISLQRLQLLLEQMRNTSTGVPSVKVLDRDMLHQFGHHNYSGIGFLSVYSLSLFFEKLRDNIKSIAGGTWTRTTKDTEEWRRRMEEALPISGIQTGLSLYNSYNRV